MPSSGWLFANPPLADAALYACILVSLVAVWLWAPTWRRFANRSSTCHRLLYVF